MELIPANAVCNLYFPNPVTNPLGDCSSEKRVSGFGVHFSISSFTCHNQNKHRNNSRKLKPADYIDNKYVGHMYNAGILMADKE